MKNLDGSFRLAGDANHFGERAHDSVAFVAHMGGVDAAVPGAFGGKGDQLVGFGVRRGRIFKSGGKPKRALLHRLIDERFHAREFVRRRSAVDGADHVAANLRCANIRAEIDPDPLLPKTREILRERSPVRRDAVVLVFGLVCGECRIRLRSDRVAFTGNLGRNALINFGWRARIDQDGQLGLAEHVDEARGDHHPLRVDRFLRRRAGEIPDRGDAPVANANVA
jgi:hypothetical protein